MGSKKEKLKVGKAKPDKKESKTSVHGKPPSLRDRAPNRNTGTSPTKIGNSIAMPASPEVLLAVARSINGPKPFPQTECRSVPTRLRPRPRINGPKPFPQTESDQDATLRLAAKAWRLAADLLDECRRASLEMPETPDGLIDIARTIIGTNRFPDDEAKQDALLREAGKVWRLAKGLLDECRLSSTPAVLEVGLRHRRKEQRTASLLDKGIEQRHTNKWPRLGFKDVTYETVPGNKALKLITKEAHLDRAWALLFEWMKTVPGIKLHRTRARWLSSRMTQFNIMDIKSQFDVWRKKKLSRVKAENARRAG